MNNRNIKRKYRGGRPPLPPEKRKVRCNVTLSRNTLKILSGISSNRSEAIEIVSGFFSGFLDGTDDGKEAADVIYETHEEAMKYLERLML